MKNASFFGKALFAAALFSGLACAEFLQTPTLKWSLQLEGSGRLSGRGLRKGNSVVAHHDGTKIVVTAGDGSLHIIQTTNLVRTLAAYVPDPIDGKSIECRSGATIVEKSVQGGLFVEKSGQDGLLGEGESIQASIDDFIVYAVVDNIIANDTSIGDAQVTSGVNVRPSGITSRVIAVDMEGALLWSVEVSGKIEGSPVVGKKGIYVTHNDNGSGQLSILKMQDGGTATIAATVDPVSEPGNGIPLGPPALQKAANGAEVSDDDLVIVAENWDAGFSQTRGGMHMLSWATSDAVDDRGEEQEALLSRPNTYQLVKISSWSYSASSPPLVYGNSIFLGAAGGTVGGFTGDRRSDLSGITTGRQAELFPRWDFQVSPNPRNASQPLRSQPVMDSTGEYLLVAGLDTDFYVFQTENGRERWRVNQASQILAQPRIFEDENNAWRKVVYVIEVQNGRVRQYDMFNGRRFWDYSCADISNSMCQDGVEADFAITPSGNIIYYGDIYGRINALEVATFATEAPSSAPSAFPTPARSGAPTTTMSPTGALTDSPTQLVVEVPPPTSGSDGNSSEEEQDESLWSDDKEDDSLGVIGQQAVENGPSKMGVYVGAAMAALCLILVPIVAFSLLRKKRRKKLLEDDDLVVEVIDDCSSDDDDLELDGELDPYGRSEIYNGGSDGYDGDGIEVEFVSPVTPTKRTPTKRKKRKKKKGPDTPATINTLESIEELSEEASAAMAVAKEKYDIEDQSMEAISLRQIFDKVAEKRAPATGEVYRGGGSNHLELAVDNNQNDDSFLSDDDDPPPPPPSDPERPSSKKWTWGSLVQKGTAQSESSPQIAVKKSSEKLELKHSTRALSPPPRDEVGSTTKEMNISSDEEGAAHHLQVTEALPSAMVIQEEEKKESEDIVSRAQTPVPTEQETPASPTRSTDGSLFDTPHHSPSNSVGSDDESLYTSYTAGTREKKQDRKDHSPLSNFANYVYDQEIRRRDRSELVNERKPSLSQPHLVEEEHPDDESLIIPGTQYMTSPSEEGANSSKYGKSVRSKRDGNSFTPRSESPGHTPLAQMYDQLAAIGQQRREEKKPGFKRRNKRTERETPSPPAIQGDERTSDTWGSFLNELAEAEKQFFTPGASRSRSLLNDDDSIDPEGPDF